MTKGGYLQPRWNLHGAHWAAGLQLTLYISIVRMRPKAVAKLCPSQGFIPLRMLEFTGHGKTLLAPLITYLHTLCKTQHGEQSSSLTQPHLHWPWGASV